MVFNYKIISAASLNARFLESPDTMRRRAWAYLTVGRGDRRSDSPLPSLHGHTQGPKQVGRLTHGIGKPTLVLFRAPYGSTGTPAGTKAGHRTAGAPGWLHGWLGLGGARFHPAAQPDRSTGLARGGLRRSRDAGPARGP